MSSSNIDQVAGRGEAGRAAGGAEPTNEERAAAATVLQMTSRGLCTWWRHWAARTGWRTAR
jgi:hypothetical protein